MKNRNTFLVFYSEANNLVVPLKMKRRILFLFILYFEFFDDFIDCNPFVPYIIQMNRFSSCPGHEKNAIHFNGSIVRIIQSKYVINGEFTFAEAISAPIEVIDSCYYLHSICYSFSQLIASG